MKNEIIEEMEVRDAHFSDLFYLNKKRTQLYTWFEGGGMWQGKVTIHHYDTLKTKRIEERSIVYKIKGKGVFSEYDDRIGNIKSNIAFYRSRIKAKKIKLGKKTIEVIDEYISIKERFLSVESEIRKKAEEYLCNYKDTSIGTKAEFSSLDEINIIYEEYSSATGRGESSYWSFYKIPLSYLMDDSYDRIILEKHIKVYKVKAKKTKDELDNFLGN